MKPQLFVPTSPFTIARSIFKPLETQQNDFSSGIMAPLTERDANICDP